MRDLFEHGQRPFACVITCADSRVVPEHIFMTGLGELFVIRVAGNVVGPIETGQRGVRLRALAHPSVCWCWATPTAAPSRRPSMGKRGPVAAITERIVAALGDVRDPYEASVAQRPRPRLAELRAPRRSWRALPHDGTTWHIRVAIYHTHCGVVDFLQRGSEILTFDGEIPLLK